MSEHTEFGDTHYTIHHKLNVSDSQLYAFTSFPHIYIYNDTDINSVGAEQEED